MSSESVLRSLLGLTVQVTVVLGLAALAVAYLRRSTAALRHRILSLALGSVLALPLVPSWIPAPHWMTRTAFQPSGAGTSGHSLLTQSESVLVEAEGTNNVSSSAGPPLTLVRDRSPASFELALGLWLLIAALLASREIAGRLGAARLSRSAVDLPAGKLADEALALARRLRIRRRVRVCCTVEVASPASLGFPSPRIFLPLDAEVWPASRRRVALLHELAHVARGDDLTQLVGRIARALLWFHPLVWWTLREVRRLAEEACDDVVVREHADPSGYAEELLGFAQRLNPATVALACLVPSPSHLERRVASILDPARSRAALPRSASLATLLSTMIAVTAIGSFGQTETQDHDERPRKATLETGRGAVADWLASQHADTSFASRSEAFDRRWRRALASAGRCWIAWSIDLGLEEATIFKRDLVVSELPELVHPTTSSLLVVVELCTTRERKVRILQVQASNAPRVLNLRGAPLCWLGAASEEDSRALLLELQAHALGEARGVLLSLLGFHTRGAPGEGAVELLERVAIESKEPREAEGALTGLSFLAHSEAAKIIPRVVALAQQPKIRAQALRMLEDPER